MVYEFFKEGSFSGSEGGFVVDGVGEEMDRCCGYMSRWLLFGLWWWVVGRRCMCWLQK